MDVIYIIKNEYGLSIIYCSTEINWRHFTPLFLAHGFWQRGSLFLHKKYTSKEIPRSITKHWRTMIKNDPYFKKKSPPPQQVQQPDQTDISLVCPNVTNVCPICHFIQTGKCVKSTSTLYNQDQHICQLPVPKHNILQYM